MRRLSILWFLVAVVSGCAQTIDMPDLALVPPGCRLPAKCYSGACPCNRASATGGIEGDCLLCDPGLNSTQQCDCAVDLGLSCVEPLQLCVGRGPACPGVGARCLDPRTAGGCNAAGGDPPTLVGVDTGDSGAPPTSEARCAYADDVCCPGTEPDGGADMAVPDLGAPPDLLQVTD